MHSIQPMDHLVMAQGEWMLYSVDPPLVGFVRNHLDLMDTVLWLVDNVSAAGAVEVEVECILLE